MISWLPNQLQLLAVQNKKLGALGTLLMKLEAPWCSLIFAHSCILEEQQGDIGYYPFETVNRYSILDKQQRMLVNLIMPQRSSQ